MSELRWNLSFDSLEYAPEGTATFLVISQWEGKYNSLKLTGQIAGLILSGRTDGTYQRIGHFESFHQAMKSDLLDLSKIPRKRVKIFWLSEEISSKRFRIWCIEERPRETKSWSSNCSIHRVCSERGKADEDGNWERQAVVVAMATEEGSTGWTYLGYLRDGSVACRLEWIRRFKL